MSFVDFTNVHQMLKATVERHGDLEAYRTIHAPARTSSVTWREFLSQVRRVGKGLIALGVGHGDKISILSYSCHPWVLTDVGAESVGAVTVGIYHTNLAKDCRYIVDHSDSVLVFAQNLEQLAKLQEERARIPALRKVVLFDGAAKDDWVISYDAFLALGDAVTDAALDARIAAVGPQDLAAIVYTSGTTGIPKGAMITHDNITFTCQSVQQCGDAGVGDVELLFLPLAHVFARTVVFTAMITATTTVFARGLDTLLEDMQVARPHWFASVPRVYEKVHSKVLAGAEAKGGVALKIFRWALKTGHEVSDCLLAKKPVPAGLKMRYGIATKLVFAKIHAAFGGRVRWCISGAAPLDPSIGKFFHAAGVLVLEGIGMTENTSFTNLNRPDNYRFGWVGLSGPGIEQRIGADGEVQYRGRNIMRGYYKMPEETAETLIDGGWQRTGDLGEIDAVGFLRITGRKKELIVTAGGKNIAPTAIEGVLGTSKYINQICVIGDRRPHLTALVTLDMDNAKAWATANGIAFSTPADLQKEPRVKQLIDSEIAAHESEFATFEQVKKVAIVDEFTIANGLLTPTLKLKRSVIHERHAKAIDAMYAGT
ncbi:MAG: long-chain fatty acid--CoA ligase [Acidobacteria bacterium]|nr:long-chain fatty acid--CoA ligase [Acidobacteriota bacterium]